MAKPKFSELVYTSILLAFLIGTMLVRWGVVMTTPEMVGLAFSIVFLAYAVLKVFSKADGIGVDCARGDGDLL
jgi:hypothetical protein